MRFRRPWRAPFLRSCFALWHPPSRQEVLHRRLVQEFNNQHLASIWPSRFLGSTGHQQINQIVGYYYSWRPTCSACLYCRCQQRVVFVFCNKSNSQICIIVAEIMVLIHLSDFREVNRADFLSDFRRPSCSAVTDGRRLVDVYIFLQISWTPVERQASHRVQEVTRDWRALNFTARIFHSRLSTLGSRPYNPSDIGMTTKVTPIDRHELSDCWYLLILLILLIGNVNDGGLRSSLQRHLHVRVIVQLCKESVILNRE